MPASPHPEATLDFVVSEGHLGDSVLHALAAGTVLPRITLPELSPTMVDPPHGSTMKGPVGGAPTHRYHFAGEIARGGMGAVLRGRDEDLGREIAVKVMLQTHAGKTELLQRFVEEAQIAGQLQHPGITPIYELGRFPDQRPYFTMKLVRGETLAQLLARRVPGSPEWPRFLKIFEQVGQTLAYAHARRVIHRDLKPGNIMVGAYGEVQVMDWGLAKVLGERRDESPPVAAAAAGDPGQVEEQVRTQRSTGQAGDTPATEAGAIMGTPTYMAPEQARGEIDHLDARADVFGLGAILCEILTGQPPYVARNVKEAYQKAAAADLTEAYERLDQCGADPELIRLTLSCLLANPQERPADAGVLTKELSAYLNGVEARLKDAEIAHAAAVARAAEALTRVKVEKRASRLAYTVAASTFLGLLAAGGLAYWAYFEKHRAEEAERQTAHALRQVREEQQRTSHAFSVAKQARDRAYDALLAMTSNAAGTTLARQPALTSEQRRFLDEAATRFRDLRVEGDEDDLSARVHLARVQYQLAGMQRALEQFAAAETTYQATLKTLERIATLAPAQEHPGLAASLVHYQLGDLYAKTGRPRLAEAHLRQAAAEYEHGSTHQPRRNPQELATVLSRLGVLLLELGRLTEADAALQRSRALQQELLARQPDEPHLQAGLADTLNSLAMVALRSGRRPTAEEAHQQSIALQKQLVALEPQDRSHRENLATYRHNHALLLRDSGRLPEAVQLLEEVLADQRQLAREYFSIPSYRRDVAATQGTLAVARRAQKRVPEAISLLREAVGEMRKVAEAFPKVQEYRGNLATLLNSLGLLLREHGQRDEALTILKEGLELRARLAADHPETPFYRSSLAEANNSLGVLLIEAGQLEDAEAAFKAAVDLDERLVREFPEELIYVRGHAAAACNTGHFLRRQKKPREALAFFLQAEAGLRRALAAEPKDVAARQHLRNTLLGLGAAHTEMGLHPQALHNFKEAVGLSAGEPAIQKAAQDQVVRATGRVLLCDPIWRAAWAWPRY